MDARLSGDIRLETSSVAEIMLTLHCLVLLLFGIPVFGESSVPSGNYNETRNEPPTDHTSSIGSNNSVVGNMEETARNAVPIEGINSNVADNDLDYDAEQYRDDRLRLMLSRKSQVTLNETSIRTWETNTGSPGDLHGILPKIVDDHPMTARRSEMFPRHWKEKKSSKKSDLNKHFNRNASENSKKHRKNLSSNTHNERTEQSKRSKITQKEVGQDSNRETNFKKAEQTEKSIKEHAKDSKSIESHPKKVEETKKQEKENTNDENLLPVVEEAMKTIKDSKETKSSSKLSDKAKNPEKDETKEAQNVESNPTASEGSENPKSEKTNDTKELESSTELPDESKKPNKDEIKDIRETGTPEETTKPSAEGSHTKETESESLESTKPDKDGETAAEEPGKNSEASESTKPKKSIQPSNSNKTSEKRDEREHQKPVITEEETETNGIKKVRKTKINEDGSVEETITEEDKNTGAVKVTATKSDNGQQTADGAPVVQTVKAQTTTGETDSKSSNATEEIISETIQLLNQKDSVNISDDGTAFASAKSGNPLPAERRGYQTSPLSMLDEVAHLASHMENLAKQNKTAVASVSIGGPPESKYTNHLKDSAENQTATDAQYEDIEGPYDDEVIHPYEDTSTDSNSVVIVVPGGNDIGQTHSISGKPRIINDDLLHVLFNISTTSVLNERNGRTIIKELARQTKELQQVKEKSDNIYQLLSKLKPSGN